MLDTLSRLLGLIGKRIEKIVNAAIQQLNPHCRLHRFIATIVCL